MQEGVDEVERSHPGVSRARKAAARNVPAHHNDNGDAHTFSVVPESGQTPEELAILATLNAEDEDAPQLDLPDAETNFALDAERNDSDAD